MNIDSFAKALLCFRDDISNKKLQKLAYYVYAWYWTIFGKAIANISFEAWEHGPVSRALYNDYRQYGWNVIPRYQGFLLVDNDKLNFIKSVLCYYGDFSADELEALTHKEEPWNLARQGCSKYEASDAVISVDSMIQCYSKQNQVREFILNEYKKPYFS